jgi:translation initiation factor IF-3
MRMARDAGLDLVEVSPNERPPVCKIMDYGKHKYLQSKKAKQKHHEQKIKEVRIRPKTDPHDREIKLKHAREFLEEGDRVQFTMRFRGRERFHKDLGMGAFADIARQLADLAKIERPALMLGQRMTMVLVPLKVPSHTPVKKSGDGKKGGDGAAGKGVKPPKKPREGGEAANAGDTVLSAGDVQRLVQKTETPVPAEAAEPAPVIETT